MNKLGIRRMVAAAGVAALTGGILLAGVGTAAADTKVTHHPVNGGEVGTNHVARFTTTYNDGVAWNATVFVDYGRSGAWTECSDGSHHHGPLVGPGTWLWGGDCYGNGRIVNYGWYDG
ncbi:hypothetical protein GCM10027598_78790 [Amycolatopsis oliviviridis]|uniref:Uncharacterized protein n=1 Tax=Amycolatopsis oliviviridis TaxID=1471590 RepID=A0ABQ3L7A3_9PSEU|nr:hypothetical protein [Amycolatopsis oliviviridis]GHH05140.1 hypothetical protein GCM10017790_08720 [Amycolatopsis oliviviridis]